MNGVSSVSVPANSFNWPRSSFGAGWNTIVPSPISTIAVTPSGVSATNTSPAGSRSSKSTDLRTRFFAANCLSGCSDEAMQAFDRREAIFGEDAPRLPADVVAARPADVETPRGDAAARAGLHEDFDDQSIAFARQRAVQRAIDRAP